MYFYFSFHSGPAFGRIQQLPFPVQRSHPNSWPAGQRQLPGNHGGHAHHELRPWGDSGYASTKHLQKYTNMHSLQICMHLWRFTAKQSCSILSNNWKTEPNFKFHFLVNCFLKKYFNILLEDKIEGFLHKNNYLWHILCFAYTKR